MPGDDQPFTPSSILFRPRLNAARGIEVEAPGTAPGSDGFITTAVYRHSLPQRRRTHYRDASPVLEEPNRQNAKFGYFSS
ncbi:hypothetical protein MCEMSEM23_01883 [Rhabdaerophilaceae bacterium]